MSYDAYKAYLSAVPSTPKERFIDSLQEFTNRDFDVASSVEVVEYQDRETKLYNNLEVRLTEAFSSKSGTRLYDDFKSIIFKDLSFKTTNGDLFKFGNYDWIVVNTSNVATETSSCIVRRCNHILKWYNQSATPVLIEEPCVIDYYELKSNVEEGKQLRLGKNIRYVLLQRNDNTLNLKRDERFIIDSRAYRITDFDSITLNGIYQLTLEEHQINESKDDLIDNVANKTNKTNGTLW